MTDAIILAAGTSSRMKGKNKLLLNINNLSIIEFVTSQIAKANVNKIIVVVGHEYKKIIQLLEKYPVEFIYNTSYKKGQTSSIQSAMSILSPDAESFMICLGDMPMLSTPDYNFLLDYYKKLKKQIEVPITRPVFKKNFGNPVLFHRFYQKEILKCDNPHNCREVIQVHKKSFEPIPVNELKYFIDIDNNEDYFRVRRSLEE